KYIEAYFTKFQGVKAFLDRTIAEAKEKGYVTTLLGRRRPIVELQSGDQTQRSMGERMAMNTPIQGTAADVIKLAMLAVRRGRSARSWRRFTTRIAPCGRPRRPPCGGSARPLPRR